MDKPQLPSFLGNISVVLTRTSHPANIGSAARAMKTMGITQGIFDFTQAKILQILHCLGHIFYAKFQRFNAINHGFFLN